MNAEAIFSPGRLWSEVDGRSAVLARTGAFHLLMLGAATLLFFIDSRQVMGINAWLKPMKFMVSITVYLWTVAWLIGYLQRPRWAIKLIAWGIAIAMIAETVCLFIQAGRGTTSHFNFATPFDGALFGTMGLMIAVDAVLMTGLLLLFCRRNLDLAAPYLWGIRVGIAVFLLGSWVGGQMIANGAHTVGAPDGGPGLPFLNWSVVAGDLRIAHALGLHGLQIMPLLGFWLAARFGPGRPAGRSVALLVGLAGAYVALLLAAFAQAKAGVPLLPS